MHKSEKKALYGKGKKCTHLCGKLKDDLKAISFYLKHNDK